MDAVTAYTYSTAAWFGVQAVPLLLFPKLITAMLSAEARRPTGTSTTSNDTPRIILEDLSSTNS